MFFDARSSEPLLNYEALARIPQLYKLESGCRELTSEQRQRVRQRESVPLLQQFGQLFQEQARRLFLTSPLNRAIGYARNQWAGLETYVCDGDLSIDNNLVERTLRAQAIGSEELVVRWQRSWWLYRSNPLQFCGELQTDRWGPLHFLEGCAGRIAESSHRFTLGTAADAWLAAHPRALWKVAS